MTRSLLIICLLLGFGAYSPSLFARQTTQDSGVDDVLDALDHAGRDLKSFSMHVKLSVANTGTGDEYSHSGAALYLTDEHGAKLRVTLDKRESDGKIRDDKVEYLLAGETLVDRNYRSKTETTRRVLKPGEKINLLKLGEGPFPLPIGQRKEDVHAWFDVSKAPPQKDDPNGTVHLLLAPKAGTRFERRFKMIDVFVDPKTGLPQKIETLSHDGDTRQTTDFSDVKINPPLTDKDFVLPPIGEDWQKNDELTPNNIPMNACPNMLPRIDRTGWWLMLTLFLLGTFLSGCKPDKPIALDSTQSFPEISGFKTRDITVDGQKLKLWIFIPYDYQPNKPTPAILFLHGLFERGKNGSNVLSAGLATAIAQGADRWPFITIFPQSTGTWTGPQRDHLAIAALDKVSQDFAVDPDRVILAGLSYGGLGVWQIGAAHPDRFAALVPVSGFGDIEVAPALTQIPVWAFASHDDMFVQADDSASMCRKIQELGGHAKYTEFDGDIHDCWQRAVGETELVSWMLQQSRNSSTNDRINHPQTAPRPPAEPSAAGRMRQPPTARTIERV